MGGGGEIYMFFLIWKYEKEFFISFFFNFKNLKIPKQHVLGQKWMEGLNWIKLKVIKLIWTKFKSQDWNFERKKLQEKIENHKIKLNFRLGIICTFFFKKTVCPTKTD